MREKVNNYADDFFRLFVKREWKVVLGNKMSNLLLLVAMLTATFLAIAFSNASMHYLSDKMNDPFIKWVDIRNSYGEGDFIGLENALNSSENMDRFDYESYQSDYYFSYMFFGAEENQLQYFQCRFFQDIKTDLVRAILDEDNVVGKARISDLYSVPDETIGIMITHNALQKLGYSEAPAYIDLCHYSIGADSLGFKLYDNEFARVPIPILAVVKRLPSNVDIIATKFFYEQENNDNNYPFNLASNHSYSESLRYFVPESVDKSLFVESLQNRLNEYSSLDAMVDEYAFYKPEILPYVPGSFVSIVGNDEVGLPPLLINEMNETILAEWKEKGVFRVFDYNFSPYSISEKSYLSVYFNRLNHIKDFESFVGEYRVKIDMSQIDSKENYNAVSIMANVLSWGIIIFAIVCIILFIIDLLKSYFQKVKKNIGTFKAFGVSNNRLISIYVLIVGSTIVIAITISLLLTLFLQELLELFGVMKEGIYGYLAIGNAKTFAVVCIIAVAAVATVYYVMRNLLKNTPGDLIYDRQ